MAMRDNTLVATSEEVEVAIQSTEHVLKLSPTPSDDPDDPLNWPLWLKVAVLIQTSLLAAIGGLNTATINPALVQVAKEFHISTVRASYQTTVCIALNGIAPWLWIPLAHRYGRRPIFLATTLLGFISILSCAYTRSFSELLVARVFNGLFPVGFALGATTVVDLFFFHQRGRALGFFTVTVTNGSHIAPIVGGLLGQYCGWRWIFKFLAIVDAIMFIVALFCLPETMYVRNEQRTNTNVIMPISSITKASVTRETNTLPERSSSVVTTDSTMKPKTRTKLQTYLHYMRLWSLNKQASVSTISFLVPTLKLFRSPSAVFPAIYYASMYGFASILPAVTVAAIFTKYFHWNTLTIGLTYGGVLTIGGILGELAAGWVCDYAVKREAAKIEQRRHSVTGTNPVPSEIRLQPIWPGVILTPAGMLIYGFTLQYHTHPALPLFGMGLSCFGLQIITTATYTYAIDTHPGRSSEVAQLFNFIRQMFGMTFAFYVVRMGEKIGFQWTFFFFAFCGGVLAFSPVAILMRYGGRIRRRRSKSRMDD